MKKYSVSVCLIGDDCFQGSFLEPKAKVEERKPVEYLGFSPRVAVLTTQKDFEVKVPNDYEKILIGPADACKYKHLIIVLKNFDTMANPSVDTVVRKRLGFQMHFVNASCLLYVDGRRYGMLTWESYSHLKEIADDRKANRISLAQSTAYTRDTVSAYNRCNKLDRNMPAMLDPDLCDYIRSRLIESPVYQSYRLDCEKNHVFVDDDKNVYVHTEDRYKENYITLELLDLLQAYYEQLWLTSKSVELKRENIEDRIKSDFANLREVMASGQELSDVYTDEEMSELATMIATYPDLWQLSAQ